MNHDVFHVFDTTLRDGAQREGIDLTAKALQEARAYGLLRPRHDADEPGPTPHDAACTLTVTLRESRGVLGRIASTLSSIPVLALSYAVVDAGRATVEIQVPRVHVERARGKLNRMVDALTVTESLPVPHLAGR
ncbi:hypothetical protein R1T08_05395 [Streptomyces sp. SBC-4]|nr:hypothetical protein [Streptomyces sp. SBC-4]MDV5143725.1 hypothetical protein [Streptomyces sp. SBC-4]